jgi:hypothetical protein
MSEICKAIRTVVLACVACTSIPAFAQGLAGSAVEPTITGVRVDNSKVDIGASVGLQVDFNTKEVSRPWCGFEISWGDGDKQDVRAGHDGADNFPLRFSHVYRTSGQFNLRISGKYISRGLKSAGACAGGDKQAILTVVDGAESKAKATAVKEHDEVERKARELAMKEVELRQMAERLERERADQDKRDRAFRASQRAAEVKREQAPTLPTVAKPQVAPSGKPTIDPF